MKLFKRLRDKTVFAPFDPRNSDTVIAVLFHRSAASLYLIYSIWAIAAIAVKIPSIVAARGDFGATVFAFFLLLCAAPAAVGATFFPRLGRLEMYSEAAFVGQILIYEITLVGSASTNPGALLQSIIILSLLVVPAARGAFIFITLIQNAKLRAK